MSNRDTSYGNLTGSGADPFDNSDADTTQQTKDKAKEAAHTAQGKGQEAANTARDKAGEMTHKAHDRADEGMDKAASGLDQAADKLRAQGGQQGGSMGSAATMTADKLDSASGYLREKDTNQIMDDLEALVRRKPAESLLAAAGIGFILSKVFK